MVKKTLDEVKVFVDELTCGEYCVVDTEYKSVNSNILIRHNKCGRTFGASYNNLKRGSRCPHCNIESKRKTTNEFIDDLYKIYGNEYTLIGSYGKSNKNDVLIKHVCGFEFYTKPNHILSGNNKCPICTYGSHQTTSSFKKKLELVKGNEYSLVGDYNTYSVNIKHNVCGHIYTIAPASALKYGCKYCAGNSKKTIEQFKQEVYNEVGNEYTVLADEYINTHTNLLMKHNKCGNEWMVEPNAFLHSFNRCPICQQSKGEYLIDNYLLNNDINFIKQYSFDDCKYKERLRFDFAIFIDEKLYCLIEFDGIQHYRPSRFGNVSPETAQEEFNKNKLRDRIKDEYCLLNNYNLIRIPYWEIKNVNIILDNLFKNRRRYYVI